MQARLDRAESKTMCIMEKKLPNIECHTAEMEELMHILCPSSNDAFYFTLSALSDVRAVQFPNLFRCLLQFCLRAMEEARCVVPFNTITVTKNLVGKLGGKCGGICAYRAFGPFTGGELQIQTEYYVTHNRTIFFDTSELHAQRWFRGTKYSLSTTQVKVSEEDQLALERLGCPSAYVPLPLLHQLKISIISRDLGSFNTYVTSKDMRLELPYKRQGIWALKLENDLCISEKELMDTYNHCDSFQIRRWEHTIYTVSDTACAASRPLPVSFYEKVFSMGLRLPRIDYRTPFLFFISKTWGNVAMIGDRRLPFMASLYFNGTYMKACSSSTLHSDYQELAFE